MPSSSSPSSKIIIICVINVQMDDCVYECTEALVVPEVLTIIGANLSEINTSVTSLHTYVCMLIGLLVWTGHLLQINTFINLIRLST